MGLLDKLWDDVLAGPQPDKGLGKLRQKSAVSAEDEEIQRMLTRRRSAEYQNKEREARRITQSISIKKPPMLQTPQDGSESPLPSPGLAGSPLASLLRGIERTYGEVCFTQVKIKLWTAWDLQSLTMLLQARTRRQFMTGFTVGNLNPNGGEVNLVLCDRRSSR